MTSNDLPPIVTGLFGLAFLAIALFYPWLSRSFGLEDARPERRLLSGVLGLALLGLWGIWRLVLRG